MSPYKNFINATRAFFESKGILKFLLDIYFVVFPLGGVLFILGGFFPGLDFLACLGVILIWAGLLLTLIKEDMLILVITSAAISVLSLLVWILAIAGVLYGGSGDVAAALNYLKQFSDALGGDYNGGGLSMFVFTTLFYFLVFGAIALIVFLKSEKFKQMRAESAARNQTAGVACPRCGGFVPLSAGFCPTCGALKPVMQAPPVQQQYAPPVQQQYAPPAQQQYAPPVQPQYAPPAAPQPEPTPSAGAVQKCVNCGTDIPQGAAFCANCGAKQ